MRHFGKVGINVAAADVFAEDDVERVFGFAEGRVFQKVFEPDGFTVFVRHFNADGIGTGNDGNTHRNRRHRAGNVVGEADDAGSFGARSRFEFVEGNDRSGADFDNFAVDAEFLQNVFQIAGDAFQFFFADLIAALVFGAGKQIDVRVQVTVVNFLFLRCGGCRSLACFHRRFGLFVRFDFRFFAFFGRFFLFGFDNQPFLFRFRMPALEQQSNDPSAETENFPDADNKAAKTAIPGFVSYADGKVERKQAQAEADQQQDFASVREVENVGRVHAERGKQAADTAAEAVLPEIFGRQQAEKNGKEN